MERFYRMLFNLTGDDYTIISRGSRQLKIRFARIGIFVLFVFLLSMLSSFLIFYNVFNNWFSVFPALVFGGLILSIYLLLLITLTKNQLPRKEEPNTHVSTLVGKYLFIILIAMLVSKPLEVMFFSNRIFNDLIDYKKGILAKYDQFNTENFEKETKAIHNLLKSLEADSTKNQEILKHDYQNILKTKNNERLVNKVRMADLINNSNFYLKKLILLSYRFPLCWIFTAMVILIFVSPVILKNLLKVSDEYYSIKKIIELQIIVDAYLEFKEQYNVLISKFGPEYEREETHWDPPFNTEPILDVKTVESETALIDLIRNAGV